MYKYLKIIRWPNLLIVPFTMILMRYCIIKPILDYQYSIQLGEVVTLQLSEIYFTILILINVLQGAAGYVINDYFDRKIDTINRPDEVIVDRTLPRRHAIIYHSVLNALAILLAAVFAWHFGRISILLFYLMISGLYWLYSTTYKKQLLVGNIVVALVTASIPIQEGIFECAELTRAYGFNIIAKGLTFKPILYWTAGFAFFAFLTNLIREIVKDMEDVEGDCYCGCDTLPIHFGMRISKVVVVSLFILMIASLLAVYHLFLHDFLTLIYIVALLIVPACVAAFMTIRASEVKHYKRISTLIKIVMVLGGLYSILARQIMQFVV